MSKQRQRVEAEAHERYPDLTPGDEMANWSWKMRRDAFIAGRTVNAAQVEAAAKSLAWILNEWEDGQVVWESPEDVAEEIAECKQLARAVFRAAGLLI